LKEITDIEHPTKLMHRCLLILKKLNWVDCKQL